MQLLHTAIATDGCDFLGALCALPAAASLSSEGIASLLQAAFSQRSAAGSILAGCAARQAINAVIHLPAFDQISCASAAQLMLAAATAAQCFGDAAHCHEQLRAVYGAFVFLCELPAARQLSSQQLLQPFQVVVQQHSGEWTERLCRLPAAQQLSSAAVEQLLLAAAAARTPDVHSIIQKLFSLPAAHDLSSAGIEQLLLAVAAVYCPDMRAFMKELLDLPAAQHLSSKAVEELLRVHLHASAAAGARADIRIVQQLTAVPAAKALSCEVWQLAAQAMYGADFRLVRP